MRPELFMRREGNAIDLFAAFLSVSSIKATEQNFDKLRKQIKRAEKRLIKEIKMKRMRGVSIGRHPYFQSRGSYDGEKMVIALRISFNNEGMERYDEVADFVKNLGFKEQALALTARIAVKVASRFMGRYYARGR
jgi:hypothetical protein